MMVSLPEELVTLVATAAADGHPIMAGSVGPDGQPELAYYGSIQPFEGDRLVLWARPPAHIAERLTTQPKLTFVYWNRDRRVMARFYGVGHVVEDPARRRAIYDCAPENERERDLEQAGAAIEVELTRVTGMLNGERFNLE